MSLNDELKKEAESTKEKISELLLQLQSFEEIKSNLSSSDTGIRSALNDFNSLIAAVNSIADNLDGVAISIKTTSDNLSGLSELIEKIDQMDVTINELKKSNKKIEDSIEASNKDVSDKFKLLNEDLVDKIKKSTLLGRFSIK